MLSRLSRMLHTSARVHWAVLLPVLRSTAASPLRPPWLQSWPSHCPPPKAGPSTNEASLAFGQLGSTARGLGLPKTAAELSPGNLPAAPGSPSDHWRLSTKLPWLPRRPAAPWPASQPPLELASFPAPAPAPCVFAPPALGERGRERQPFSPLFEKTALLSWGPS